MKNIFKNPLFFLYPAFAAILLTISVYSCGLKGDPIAPHVSPPSPPSDIKAFSKNNSAILTWDIPAKNMDGTRLKEVSKFFVLRADVRDRESGGCGCAYTRIAVIDMQKPDAATIKDGRVAFIDYGDDLFPSGLAHKIPYAYKIIAETKSGLLSPESAEVVVIPTIPPKPPLGFHASVQNGTVILKWEQSQEDIKGCNIYRSKEKGAYSETPVNRDLIKRDSASFADIGLEPGTYFYIIKATDTSFPPFNEGPASEEITIQIER